MSEIQRYEWAYAWSEDAEKLKSDTGGWCKAEDVSVLERQVEELQAKVETYKEYFVKSEAKITRLAAQPQEENRKLKVKAALYDAVEEAAHYLNDAEITLEIENGSVSVVLQQQRGTTRIEGADQSLAEQISEALDLAQPQE